MTLTAAPLAVVVDASVAVSFLTREPAWLRQWAEWADSGAMLLAPAHFPAEVANALLRSARQPAPEVITALGRLSRSGVETADRGTTGLLDAVALADKHRLSVYDALYLQLALEIDADLATLDGNLRQAADAEGVTVVS